MKKFFAAIFAALLLFTAVGCKKAETMPIESYEWVMPTIQLTQGRGVKTIAYNPAAATDFDGYTNHECTPISMACSALNGKLTLKNATANETYYGTYSHLESSRDSSIYTIALEGVQGTAVSSFTAYEGGEKVPT